MSSFVGWFGKTIHGEWHSSIVNKMADRKDKESSNMVFHKHFKDFKWQITNVFRLKMRRDLVRCTRSRVGSKHPLRTQGIHRERMVTRSCTDRAKRRKVFSPR